jgi:hypothetical protein
MTKERRTDRPQVPADDPLWGKSSEILARGHRLERMSAGNDVTNSEEVLVLDQPAWWGVSIGNPDLGLAYAVRATNKNGALDLFAMEVGAPNRHELGTASWHLHPDVASDEDGLEIRVQDHLDERYPDRDIVRMQLFSLEEYPAEADTLFS